MRQAARIKADFIVAGRHAGRRPATWFLRLTDWELMRSSPVPVLLIKTSRPYRRPVLLAAVNPGHAFAKTARLDEEILRIASAVGGALRGRVLRSSRRKSASIARSSGRRFRRRGVIS